MFPQCTLTILVPGREEVVLGDCSAREPLQAVRARLAGILETCAYTQYSFVTAEGAVLSDLTELCTLIPVPVSVESSHMQLSLTLGLRLERYTKRTAAEHVARVRQLVDSPWALRALGAEAEAAHTRGALKPLPEQVGPDLSVDEEARLEGFAEETLLRLCDPEASADAPEAAAAPRDALRGVTYSGYNPPSAARLLCGDLFYLEAATASEGTLFLTATCSGFFVNRSTRSHLDPSPAAAPCHAHALLHTLLLCSARLRDAWRALSARPAPAPRSPLASLAALLEDRSAAPLCDWLALSKPDTSYNMSRAMAVFADNFGVEDHGAPREWNEEFQAARAGEGDRLTTAKYLHKLNADFFESCLRVVTAIVDGGHITPLNPSDPPALHVFIYNNMFVSRSSESPDLFKLLRGDAAVRKSAGHDLLNMAVLEALEVPGLHFVKSHVFDYKGGRLVVQAILPGIVNAGQAGARLMLGSLESGKPIKCKAPALEKMRQVAERLSLAERVVTCFPCPAPPPVSVAVEDEEATPLPEEGSAELSAEERARRDHRQAAASARALEAMYSDAGNPENSPQTIAVDEEEEVGAGEGLVPVAGAVETKVILGSDRRMYVLEAVRLTPRDANYVPARLGGTGRIDEAMLDAVEEAGLGHVYLLRRELVQSFSQRRSDIARQELLSEAFEIVRASKLSAAANPAAPAVKDALILPEDEVASAEGGAVESVPAEVSITEADVSEAFAELVKIPQNAKRLSDDSALVVNVNCFLSFPADSSPDTVRSDEAVIRQLSEYLFDHVLPALTENIRIGALSPLDGAELTTALHSHGVNMRYLGRLALLAQLQEEVDAEHSRQSPPTRRIRGMPYFWLELLETEMVARAFKILLSEFLAENEDARSAPGRTIASMLNAVLGAPDGESDAVDTKTATKGKAKKSRAQTDAQSQLQPAVDLAANREAFLERIYGVVMARFNYSLKLLFGARSKEDSISPRIISRVPLLRRICKLSGLAVACRNYAFEDADSMNLLPSPITVDDIVSLSPVTKGPKPSEQQPVREIRDLLKAAQGMSRNSQFEEAFSLAQDASSWIQQVIPFVHVDAAAALEVISSVVGSINDWEALASFTEKSLSMWVQLRGLDCAEVVRLHGLRSFARSQLGDFHGAVMHLNAAKYIVGVISGPRHPDHVSLLLQLASIYKLNGHFSETTQFLLKAHYKLISGGCSDQKVCSFVFSEMAEVFAHNRDIQRAIDLQTNSYRIAKQLMDKTDEALVAKKNALEAYIRLKFHENTTGDAATVTKKIPDGDPASKENAVPAKKSKKGKK